MSNELQDNLNVNAKLNYTCLIKEQRYLPHRLHSKELGNLAKRSGALVYFH